MSSVFLTAALTTTSITVHRIVWLVGLRYVVKDARPNERAAILRAYDRIGNGCGCRGAQPTCAFKTMNVQADKRRPD